MTVLFLVKGGNTTKQSQDFGNLDSIFQCAFIVERQVRLARTKYRGMVRTGYCKNNIFPLTRAASMNKIRNIALNN